MNYNITSSNQVEFLDKNFQYKNFISSKKNLKTKNLNNLSKLQLKIKELDEKMFFYKKYEDSFNNCLDDVAIDNTIEIIDQIILKLSKNIITNGQFNRNCQQIEFEF